MRRRGKIGVLMAALLLAALPLKGQFPPKRSLEELERTANPTPVPGGEAMRFERLRIETGEINEDDAPRTYTYRWRNEGAEPLVITRVESSCGCAKPTYDRNPVAAGGSGEVRIVYHPKGHPGNFRRKILVYTQLSEQRPTAVLELTGRATPSVLPTYDYPHAMGPLLLKQRTLRLSGEELQAERIECLNVGDEPLRLSARKGLLPEYLAFECEPEIFAPGQKGDLIVRFDPAYAPQNLPKQIPLILEGLRLPPSRRTLRIEIGADEPKR
ncbi:MAG: DUF1573 domain-containing protein [Alistipes sp.]|nr:DUF1573 domain-containing protein [Alistipes senegalensis]MCM1249875.1 DUF1573 domain-containing protein [Alistipes sp.]